MDVIYLFLVIAFQEHLNHAWASQSRQTFDYSEGVCTHSKKAKVYSENQ